eukprot:8645553-Ditylum_brightwellii.AAC.1
MYCLTWTGSVMGRALAEYMIGGEHSSPCSVKRWWVHSCHVALPGQAWTGSSKELIWLSMDSGCDEIIRG